MPSPFARPLIAFLRELSANNNREWFAEHKTRYQRDVQQPALTFIEAMAPMLKRLSPHLTADARKMGGSLMRIYRDTRFARDKRPYKTNVGIQFRHRKGKDVHAPGLYFHIEPGSTFLGAGLWHPERAALNAIRDAIVERPKAWTDARNRTLKGRAWSLEGDSLKRAPSGVDPEHPLIEDLRRTDFIAIREFPETTLWSPRLLETVIQAYTQAAPMMKFLCGALDLDW